MGERKIIKCMIDKLINILKQRNLSFKKNGDLYTFNINNISIVLDKAKRKFEIPQIKYGRESIFNLRNEENLSVVMLLIQLIEKGYSIDNIELEKSYQTGHSPIYPDVTLNNPNNGDVYFIEVKNKNEFDSYSNPNNEKKVKQLFSYAMQESSTKIASFYSYDFDNNKPLFASVFCEDLRKSSINTDDFFDRWNKIFDKSNWIDDNEIFLISKKIIKFEQLENINKEDTDILFRQFQTILRLNSVSDKPTAFMKMINLFLSKLADEISEDKSFSYVDYMGNINKIDGLKFQYIDGETPESFMKRLNDLYKEGMKQYLNKNVIDYNDNDIEEALGNGNNIKQNELKKIFDDLRLKKDVTFSFIDVYDEDTFFENYRIVKDIVSMIERYKLKYETQHQFLGDFFEEMLNTSLKQEAGQFFTPYPLVNFMINSLDIEKRISDSLENRNIDFIPKAIDYACGAGHFLVNYMSSIQKYITSIDETKCTNDQKKRKNAYMSDPYSWVKNCVVGIEKDYRLAKTTKIATFLNGDGMADIISGDGINKFSCKEYKNTILYNTSNKNEIFDYVISNPPYSVEGFMLNFQRNGIDKNSNTFSLLKDDLTSKETCIEIYFVERMWQLLKNNGIGAIVLPQSVLSQSKYKYLREFLFNNFKILSLLLTADITFSDTTTSPVILFVQKCKIKTLDYKVLIHKSPKYSNPTGQKMKNKEKEFLGYEFSSDRNKPTTTILKTSVLSNLSVITKEFIENRGNNVNIDNVNSEFTEIRLLSEIILNQDKDYVGDIYPKYKKKGGLPLSCFCKINARTEESFDILPKNYIEIGNLKDQIPSKQKRTTRYCKQGDILISSLTPRPEQIVIAQDDFMLTTAIHVLSDFKDEKTRNLILEFLRTNECIAQMNTLLDGFKVTYAKISEQNLYNNVNICI